MLDLTDEAGAGFCLVEGSRRVSKASFDPPRGGPFSCTREVVSRALKGAAARNGSLLDLSLPEFYTKNIGRGVLRNNITYDAFVAGALMDILSLLEREGYLAFRSNGDSIDYWLAMPDIGSNRSG